MATQASSLTTSKKLPLNRQTHVALTRHNGVYRIYLNGQVDCEYSSRVDDEGYRHSNSLDLRIGSRYSNRARRYDIHNEFVGNLQMAYFFNKCLDETAIEDLNKMGTSQSREERKSLQSRVETGIDDLSR